MSYTHTTHAMNGPGIFGPPGIFSPRESTGYLTQLQNHPERARWNGRSLHPASNEQTQRIEDVYAAKKPLLVQTLSFPESNPFWRYVGEVRGPLFGQGRLMYIMSGRGSLLSKDGSFYKGEMSHNFPNGVGSQICKDGSYYEGDFVNGLHEGKGLMVFNMGDPDSRPFLDVSFSYEGDWARDLPNGKGAHKCGGNTYRGDMVDGFFKGFGHMIFKNGAIYIGEWDGGMLHGQGTLWIPDLSNPGGYRKQQGRFIRGAFLSLQIT